MLDVIGDIHARSGDLVGALDNYRKELSTAKSIRHPEITNRALGQIGRIHVKSKRYVDAIKVFDEKLPYTKEKSIERAWILHDMGRCYLELKKLDKAETFGASSMVIADELRDRRWGLNARVLIAQSQGNLV